MLWQKKYPDHFDANTLIVGICLGNDLVQTYTKLKSIELNQSFSYHPVNDPYYDQVMGKENLPLSALDAEMRSSLQDEIVKVHQLAGVTTIMVSHDLSEVFRLASQVLYLENGTITRTGKPEEVFSDNSISGKVQITGTIAKIDRHEVINIVTVITGNNQIIRVIAFESDLETLKTGDQVMVYSKAFNPIITKLK